MISCGAAEITLNENFVAFREIIEGTRKESDVVLRRMRLPVSTRCSRRTCGSPDRGE